MRPPLHLITDVLALLRRKLRFFQRPEICPWNVQTPEPGTKCRMCLALASYTARQARPEAEGARELSPGSTRGLP
jgi:hypothetical protein